MLDINGDILEIHITHFCTGNIWYIYGYNEHTDRLSDFPSRVSENIQIINYTDILMMSL